MKKTVLLFVVAMLFVLTIPVAAQYYQPVGERISLLDWCFSGSETFPANTPFHISHGFWLGHDYPLELPSEFAAIRAHSHKGSFELVVDDETLQPSGRWRYVDPETARQAWNNIYEFKEGMTGTHEFQGIWSFPICTWFGIPASECEDIHAKWTGACIVEITFTE